jgi:hypothetical protein
VRRREVPVLRRTRLFREGNSMLPLLRSRP